MTVAAFLDFWYDYWLLMLAAVSVIFLAVILVIIIRTRKKSKDNISEEVGIKNQEEVIADMEKELSNVQPEDIQEDEKFVVPQRDVNRLEGVEQLPEDAESTATEESGNAAEENTAAEIGTEAESAQLRTDLCEEAEIILDNLLRRTTRQYYALSEEIRAEMEAGKRKKGRARSMEQKLYEGTPEFKEVYDYLKNLIMSYSFQGKKRRIVRTRMSKRVETFKAGRVKIARIAIAGKSFKLFVARNPADYDVKKFRHKDFGHKMSYAAFPMMVKVRSNASKKRAAKLIAEMFAPHEFSIRESYERVDYVDWYTVPADAALERAGQESKVMEVASNAAADEVMSDEEALAFIIDKRTRDEAGELVKPIKKLKVIEEHVSTADISEKFEKGQVIDLSSLKQAKLIPRKTTFVKVVSKGKVTKPLTVKVNDITVDAAKMITMTGGQVILVD